MDATVPEGVLASPEAPGAVEAAIHDGGVVLHGWVWEDPLRPVSAPEVAFDVSGLGLFVCAVGQAATPGGVRRFEWALPRGAGLGCRLIRAYDLRTGEELAGSPIRLGAGGPPDVEDAPLSDWPRGLAGQAGGARPVGLASGLWASVAAPAFSFRFELCFIAVPGSGEEEAGVRVVADAAAGRIALHLRPIGAMPPAGVRDVVRVTAGLAEAAARDQPVMAEIWLTRREGDAFTTLRRLRRMRLFRRAATTRAELILTEEEADGEGELVVSLILPEAKGVVALPPRLGDAPEAALRMEDPDLERSFEVLRRMVSLTAGPSGAGTPLLPAAGGMPSGHPAEPVGEGHPPTLVVVPVYNGDSVVRDCLRALKSAATGPVEVLVVDDGSRGFTAEMLREEVRGDPRFVLHRRDVNRGYTKSINEGVLLRRAPWTVILNSDTLVTRGWLDRMHAAARARPGTGMVGPLSNAATWQSIPAVKRPDGTWSTNDVIQPFHRERVQELLSAVSERAYPEFPILNGFCTLIADAVFDRVGLFDDEAFPMGYGEETDLCLRARAAGFRLVVADDCFVYHHKSVSFGSANRLRLSRAGGLELVNKHPGVHLPGLEAAMADHPAMLRLRTGMDALLAELA